VTIADSAAGSGYAVSRNRHDSDPATWQQQIRNKARRLKACRIDPRTRPSAGRLFKATPFDCLVRAPGWGPRRKRV